MQVGDVIREYSIQKVLGSGSFGVVYLAIKGGIQYAIKEMLLNDPNLPETTAMDPSGWDFVDQADGEVDDFIFKMTLGEGNVYREIRALESLKGVCGVSQIEESFQDKTKVYICLKYYYGGDLGKDSLSRAIPGRDAPQIKLSKICDISKQLLLALKNIHEAGIVHLDIKPENIMFRDKNYQCVNISDFGLSCIEEDRNGSKENPLIAGSPFYIDPLMWEKVYESFEDYKSNDIFSLGSTIYELYYGKTPRREWFEMHLPAGQTKDNFKDWLTKRTGMAAGFPEELFFINLCFGLLDFEVDDVTKRAVSKGGRYSIDKAITELDTLIVNMKKQGTDFYSADHVAPNCCPETEIGSGLSGFDPRAGGPRRPALTKSTVVQQMKQHDRWGTDDGVGGFLYSINKKSIVPMTRGLVIKVTGGSLTLTYRDWYQDVVDDIPIQSITEIKKATGTFREPNDLTLKYTVNERHGNIIIRMDPVDRESFISALLKEGLPVETVGQFGG